jgi:DNA-binding PadR family transcriptional regulator
VLSVVGQHRLGQRPYAFVALPCTMYCMVADEGPASLAQMRRGAADGLVTSEGTVYPLLTRLRREGLVDTVWRESNQGPPRRYYRITPHGRRALEGFVGQWERFRDAVDRLVVLGGKP